MKKLLCIALIAVAAWAWHHHAAAAQVEPLAHVELDAKYRFAADGTVVEQGTP